MDLPPTQVFDDNDFSSTQKLFDTLQDETNRGQTQIGVLTIGTNSYPIKNGINKIGRHPACSIILNDPTVSKNHAEIEANSGESSAWICDLHSSNKTKLNNTTLRPGRCYELKNESVIEFGTVRAVYKTNRSFDESLIPATPAPTRQQQNKMVIPGTPDSSLNNSSTLEDNVSIIPGTQAGDDKFRRPSLPLRGSTGSRKSFIQDSSLEDSINNSPSFIMHGKENVGVPRIGIDDMETQKEFESLCDTDVDIHDVETQKICMNSIRAPGNSLPAQGANIHDVETQHEEDIETQPQITNIHDLETQPQITNIHDLETQPQVINIHDLETQPQIANIQDIETQREDVDIHDVKTPTKTGVENISMANSDDITRDDRKSKLEKQELTMKNENDICDMETQKIEVKENSPSSSDVNSHKDQHTEVSSTVTSVNQESVTTRINQIENDPKGSQECLQLSLATNFEDDSTELDRSHNLIGSQNLLDILENDNSSDETKSEPSTLIGTSRPSVNKSAEKSTDDENIFDAATQVKDDSDNLFDAATQRINCPFKASLTDDDSDDTDQEGVFQRYSRISSQDSTQPSKSQAADSDSETDEEGHFTEIAMKKNRASCSFETRQNESKEITNEGGTSKDSDDLFEAPTQQISLRKKDSPIKEAEDSKTSADYDMPTQVIDTKEPEFSVRTEEKTNTNDIYDLAPTQVIVPDELPAKINESSVNLTAKKTTVDDENEDITEMEDNTIQILSNPEKVSDVAGDESPKINVLEEYSVEDIDYEMAATQLITEVRKEKSVSFDESGKNVSKKSKKLNFDDTIERNLNEMFDDVNEENLGEHTEISTQVLTNVLQSSQCEDKFNDNPTEDNKSPNIGNVKKFSKGRKSKGQVGSSANSGRKSLNSDLKINTTDTDSQNSETYFSALTSTRKRNILGGSQDSDAPVENTSDRKKEEKVAVVSETVDLTSDKNNSVFNTSLRLTPTNSSTPRSSGRHMIEESTVCEPIAEETDLSENNKDTPTLSSKKVMDRKSVSPIRIYKLIEDDEEDIMAGLPEVMISGTFSDPGSPTSSTSNAFNFRGNRTRAKQEAKRGRPKKRGTPRKSWQLIKKPENAEPYHTIVKADSSTLLRNIGAVDAHKASMQVHESDEEKVNKPSKRVTRKASSESLSKSRMSKSAAQQKSVPSVDTQEQAIRGPAIQSNGRTRNLSKENVDRSSVFQVGIEALVESAGPAKRSTIGSSRSGKRSLSTTDENESTSAKKRKEDLNIDVPLPTRGRKSSAKNAIGPNRRNSANILDYMAKRSSPMNVEMSSNAKLSFNQADFSAKQLLIKVARMSPCTPTESLSPRSPTVSMPENTISNETKKTRRASVSSQSSSNSLSNGEAKKVVENVRTERNTSQRVSRRKKQAEDISSQVGEESQEVEMIMNQQFKMQTTVQTEKRKDTNENARSTRTRNARKRVNETTDHTDTESIASSDICESDNTNFEMPTSKAKRSRVSKNASNAADSTVNEPTTTRTRRNIKQPSRSTRNQQQSITDSSVEESKEITAAQTSVSNSSSQVSTAKRRGRKLKTEKQPEEIIEETSSTDINSSFDNASVPSTPRMRRSIASSSFVTSSPLKVKHKILFTGIPSNDYNKLLTKLGASQVEDPTKCSVLVTDKVRRTIKFLCALAQSVPIVSVDWLAESEKAGQFVEWENYILKDPAAEAKFGFKLRKSLEKAKEQKLLEGYTIVLTPNVAPPPLPELKSIISSCGGKPLVRPPSSWPAKAVIISCETDLVNAKKFLVKAPKTVTLQSTEFLLTGILRQELNFDKHKLT